MWKHFLDASVVNVKLSVFEYLSILVYMYISVSSLLCIFNCMMYVLLSGVINDNGCVVFAATVSKV